MLSSVNMATRDGSKLAELRKRLGLSPREAEKRSGVARNTIKNIEEGGGRPVSRDRYERFLQEEASRRGNAPELTVEERIQRLQDGIGGDDVDSMEILSILADTGSPEERDRLLALIRIMFRKLKQADKP